MVQGFVENGFYAHFRSERSHLEHLFQYQLVCSWHFRKHGVIDRAHALSKCREITLFTVRARARSIRRARWLFTVHVAYVAVACLITMLDSCLCACYLNGAYSGNLCGVFIIGLSVTVTVSDFIRSRRSVSGCYSRIAIRPHRSIH